MSVAGHLLNEDFPISHQSVGYKWVDNTHRIMGFTAFDENPGLDAAEGWETATREALNYIPDTRIYLGLYDFSQVRFVTAHLRYWCKHLETLADSYHGHYAVVVSARSFEQIIEMINQQNNTIGDTLKAGVFPSREKAIAYLAQFV